MRNKTERSDSVRYSEMDDMEVIVSVTGSDNDLIIVTLSEIINRFNGNLQASRFNRIDKTFNGLFYISLNMAYFGRFRACLESLNSDKLQFEFSPANSSSNSFTDDKTRFEIELYGLKEKAVDVELLRALAQNQLVVDELSRKSYICNEGKKAYKVRFQVSTEYVFDIDELEKELQFLAEKLDLHLVVNFDDELQEAI
ncbi:hypothetical protein [Kangiella marina]|uniref:Glycine cleavage system transcriptional repressor n=1 Tax=Kangiella marina TaxID=1079178 RepID=A0ABP8ILE1_9GAMM